MIIVDIDFPQGTNEGYRLSVAHTPNGPRARMSLSHEIVAWKDALHTRIMQARPGFLDAPASPRSKTSTVATARGAQTVPLALAAIWITPKPLPYDRDLDGPYKFVQDVVARAWGFNDSQIRTYLVSELTCPHSASTRLALHLARKEDLPSIAELEARVLKLMEVPV